MKSIRAVLLMLALQAPMPGFAAGELGPTAMPNVTRVRVALVPEGILFRAPLTEASVWTSACVYESSSPAAIASLLHLLNSYPQPAPASPERFLIRHAIELTEFGQSQRMVLSDLISEPGRHGFLRGRWRGADPLSVREVEMAPDLVDQLRRWAGQPGAVLSAGSRDGC